jgi:hypothetical protein
MNFGLLSLWIDLVKTNMADKAESPYDDNNNTKIINSLTFPLELDQLELISLKSMFISQKINSHCLS